jgi:hypothetical protein
MPFNGFAVSLELVKRLMPCPTKHAGRERYVIPDFLDGHEERA